MVHIYKFIYFIFILVLAILINGCKTSSPLSHNPKVIDINNIPENISDDEKIPYGKEVSIKLINVNKDHYDVIINGKKTSHNIDVPSSLSLAAIGLPNAVPFGVDAPPMTELILPTDEMFDAMMISIDNNEDIVADNTCVETFNSERSNLKTQTRKFYDGLNNFNSAIKAFNQLGQLQQECIDSWNSTLSKKNKILAVFGDNPEDPQVIEKYIKSNYSEIEAAYNSINLSLDVIDSLINKGGCTNKELKSIKLTDREKGFYAKLDDYHNKAKDLVLNDQVFMINKRIASINDSNYTVSSEKLRAKKADEIQYTVSIKPKNWVPCDVVEKTFKVNYKVEGGVKVDFSTGIFGNFGDKDFHGNTYFLDSTATIRQLDKSSKAIIPSIGGFLHIYRRTGDLFNYGLSAGASITTDLKISNFHLGPSIMFNTDNEILNRLAVSVGFTWRPVSVLSSAYTVGTAVDENLTIEQLEVKRYKRGGFIALTWNLTKREK